LVKGGAGGQDGEGENREEGSEAGHEESPKMRFLNTRDGSRRMRHDENARTATCQNERTRQFHRSGQRLYRKTERVCIFLNAGAWGKLLGGCGGINIWVRGGRLGRFFGGLANGGRADIMPGNKGVMRGSI